ncbi:uncharacterized protein CTRU02_213210 [Colletotrichum truncatum]|uniref:Uncharacterized protein n=1 Tax=Colletotrichum truncatum TaxID=5467 RepID=A0ACC3YKF6_COLTU|nr:uncharacterized protein CTRU02_12588 [Colletotrichum truncatum]KAF6784326.1 hypothetical protein CTRU02_12588 [Colletotrichum truncatum]
MASLSTLAEDIIHSICEYLSRHDIFQLTLVAKRFAFSFERSPLLHYDLASKEYQAMIWFLLQKDFARVESLLKFGYDPNHAVKTDINLMDKTIDHISLLAPSNVAVRGNSVVSLVLTRLYCPACDTHNVYINYSVLAHAIMSNQVDMVKLLSKYGADIGSFSVRAFDHTGTLLSVDHSLSALHLATSGQMIETVLQLSPDIFIDKKKLTDTEPLLLWHVERGTDVHALRLLLEAGAHVDGARPARHRIPFCQCDNVLDHIFIDHQTPLEAAIWNLDRDAVRLLLDSGASFEYQFDGGVETTCLNEVIKLFLFENHQNDFEVSNDIFRMCAAKGLDVNRQHIEWCGYNPHGTRHNPLIRNEVNLVFEALVYNVSAKMFEAVLEVGGDPSLPFPCAPPELNDPVLFALATSLKQMYPTENSPEEQCEIQIAKMKAMLRKRSRPDGAEREAMIKFAVCAPSPDTLHRMLRMIHEVYGPFNEDTTILGDVLHHAKRIPGIFYELRQTVEFLVSNGAPVNGVNAEGKTALHIAYSLPVESPAIQAEGFAISLYDIDAKQGFSVGFALGTGICSIDSANEYLSELLRQPEEVAKRQKNALEIFDTLLQHGKESLDTMDNEQQTPLMIMAQNGWLPAPRSPSPDIQADVQKEARVDNHEPINVVQQILDSLLGSATYNPGEQF